MKNIVTAIKSSILAGEEIMKVYQTDDFQVTTKSDDSPLTLADQKSHNKIIEFLEPTEIPILSEEGRSIDYEIRKNWTKFWLIDPLDGTKEFIKQNGDFTVNIALIENKLATVGIIYIPVTKELYFSEKSVGAYKIDKITSTELSDLKTFDDFVKISQKLPLKIEKRKFTAVGSRSHKSEETQKYFDELQKKHGDIEIMPRGSSLKICMVAEGKADIYPRFGPTMEWDTAAGHAIAIAANCSFTIANTNNEVIYNKENLLNPFFIVER